MGMNGMNISLDEEQHRAHRHRAAEERTSAATLVRRAADASIATRLATRTSGASDSASSSRGCGSA
jgi:predicted kinase